MERKVLFTCRDKQTIREELELPGITLNPPKFLLYDNKLFEYKGSGLGDSGPTNFYHEVENFFIAEQTLSIPACKSVNHSPFSDKFN